MKKYLVVFLITSFLISYAQDNVMHNKIEIGTNMLTNRPVEAEEYDFLDNLYDIHLDTASKYLTIELRNLSKDGKYYKNKGEVLVFDLQTKQVKWSKPVHYNVARIEQYGNALLHTTAQATMLFDLETGKTVWTRDKKIFTGIPSRNLLLGHTIYGSPSPKLEGIDEQTGKTLWTRKFDNSFGWDQAIQLKDTGLLVSASGLHTVNFNTGQGWDYSANTGKKDYSKTVGANVVGVALGLLTGTFVVSTGYDVMSGMVSEVVMDSTGYFYASHDEIARISKNGQALWNTTLPVKTGSTRIATNDSTVYLINYGKAKYNGRPLHFGKPYFAAYDINTGQQLYVTNIDQKDNCIINFMINADTLQLVFKDQVQLYSLRDGSFIGNTGFDTALYGTISETFTGTNAYVRNDSGFVSLRDLDPRATYAITSKKQYVRFSQSLQAPQIIPTDSIYRRTLSTDKMTLLYKDAKVTVLDTENRKTGELNAGWKHFVAGSKIYGLTHTGLIEFDTGQFEK